jgi:SAM-dependent methyltransferase
MHDAAFQWVARHAAGSSVVDAGGRNVNGTVRSLFPGARFTSVDVRPGDGVDVVADFATWEPDELVDTVVCTEVAEHTPDWPLLVQRAAGLLLPGGRFIFTAAGPGRAPHSAEDGGPVRHGEHYENIDPAALASVLAEFFAEVTVDVLEDDVRAVAVKA